MKRWIRDFYKRKINQLNVEILCLYEYRKMQRIRLCGQTKLILNLNNVSCVILATILPLLLGIFITGKPWKFTDTIIICFIIIVSYWWFNYIDRLYVAYKPNRQLVRVGSPIKFIHILEFTNDRNNRYYVLLLEINKQSLFFQPVQQSNCIRMNGRETCVV